KTLNPLFLDHYRNEADRLIAETIQIAPLLRLQREIASNIYVDPACGAGNFLNIAYAKLRQIETDLIVERRKRERLAYAGGERLRYVDTHTGSRNYIGAANEVLDVTIEQLLTTD